MSPPDSAKPAQEQPASALKAALRQARIEAAERTGVVVDLHDAELARLEMLNDALDPVFAALPSGVDLFDRGVSPGEPPRLWIDMVAHVAMGRDKRLYRFVQDTRYGRSVIAESTQTEPIVQAVTTYVARRLTERERALAGDSGLTLGAASSASRALRWWNGLALFVLGMLTGAVALLALAWFLEPLI